MSKICVRPDQKVVLVNLRRITKGCHVSPFNCAGDSQDSAFLAPITICNQNLFTGQEPVISAPDTNRLPRADFTAVPTSGDAPLSVQFTDSSFGNPDSWYWDFGDGNTSDVQNPLHNYQFPGAYTVTLIVGNTVGSDGEVKPNLVIAALGLPVTDFTANNVSGNNPLNVSFTDTTTKNPISWLWNFGDGNTSTQQNPTHQYANVGNYTVTLTATNLVGSDSEVKMNYISVFSPVLTPVADFTGTPLSGNQPLTVTFTDTSTNLPTSWLWNFGDGGNSTLQNPVYQYANAGTYTVTLTATNTAGFNTRTRTGYITVNAVIPVPPDNAPGTPTNLVANSTTPYSAVILWNLADALDTSITLQRAPDNTGSPGTWGTIVTLAGGNNIYWDMALYPTTKYHYRISASNVAGSSNFSSAVNTTTTADTAISNPITNFAATVNSAWQITLTCTVPVPNPGGAQSIWIERSQDNGLSYKVVDIPYGGIPGATASYTDTGLTPATTYLYRARTVNGASESSFCLPVSATTSVKPSGFPTVPTGVVATTFSDTVCRVTWTDTNSGTTAYKIEKLVSGVPQTFEEAAKASGWTTVGTTSVGATTYDIPATARSVFFVRVRGTNGTGDSGPTVPVLGMTSNTVATPTTYTIGPGQTYTSLNAFDTAVGFSNLHPGDTVNIQCNTDINGAVIPYYEAFMIRARGTPTGYIRIVGIPHPGTGQKPIISGLQGIETSGYTPAFSGFTGSGILIGNTSTFSNGFRPGYIEINGLSIREFSVDNSPNTYTTASGSVLTYIRSVAAIYVICGNDIIIRNNEISFCGNGIFGEPNYGSSGINTMGENWLIEGNYFHDCGAIGSDRQHSSYMGVKGITYQYNLYANLRSGAFGGALKDRSSNTLIRYNWIAGGARYLDLVEAENGFGYIIPDPNYYAPVRVYGNLFENLEAGDAVSPIHVGGDSGAIQYYRKGVLQYYHNTQIVIRNLAQLTRSPLFDGTNGYNCLDARNSLVFYKEASPGNQPPALYLFNHVECSGYFGVNWLTPGWTTINTGTYLGQTLGTSNFLNSTGNNPGLLSYTTAEYSPLQGQTPLQGVGSRLPNGVSINREYVKNTSSTIRTSVGVGGDIGAFTATLDVIPPTVTSVNVDAAGTTLTVNFSEGVVGHNGFTISATGGAVSLTYASGDGSAIETFALSRLILQGEAITLNYAPGNIVDSGSNPLATITNRVVTNNSTQVPDITPPIVSGTPNVNQAGNQLAITFSESVVGNNGFTLTGTAGAISLTYSSGVGTSRVYVPSRNIAQGETLTLGYTPGNIVDLSGNLLATFSGMSVTNNSLSPEAGTPSVANFAASGLSVAGTTINVPVPSGVVNGDLLLFEIEGIISGITGTTGWTLLQSQVDSIGAGQLNVYWKFASSEPSQYTFAFPSARTPTAAIIRITGNDPTVPINVSGKAAPAAGTTQNSPSVTTTVSKCLILRFLGTDRNTLTISVPAGHVQQFDYAPDTAPTASSRLVLASTGQSSPGATGTAAFTIANGRATSQIVVAIAPAP